MNDSRRALAAFGLPATAMVPITDRGLAYGDGLFETLAVTDGIPKLLDGHLARLQRGLDRLRFTGISLDDVANGLRDAAEAVGGAGALKLTVTRGDGPRGYAPPTEPHPRWWLQEFPWSRPVFGTAGAKVALSSVRLGEQPLLAGLKHLNRLEQVLARIECPPAVADEALLLDTAGRVVCATAANVFVVRQGELLTPGVDRCGVAGVVRSALLAGSANGTLPWPVTEADLSLEAFYAADEVFLTSALRGVWPVSSLNGQAISVGPVARACFHYWEALP